MRSCNILVILVALSIVGCDTTGKNQSVVLASYPETSKMIIEKSAIQFDRGRGLALYQDSIFTGTVFSKYANDSMAVSIDYVRGKRHGRYQKWFEDGRLCFQAYYAQGKQEGLARSWWTNGKLRSETFFVKGVAEGVQKQYYQSGSLFKKMHLINGKEEGLQQSWRENGKLYNNYEAKNGRVFGLKRSKLCYKLSDEKITFNE